MRKKISQWFQKIQIFSWRNLEIDHCWHEKLFRGVVIVSCKLFETYLIVVMNLIQIASKKHKSFKNWWMTIICSNAETRGGDPSWISKVKWRICFHSGIIKFGYTQMCHNHKLSEKFKFGSEERAQVSGTLKKIVTDAKKIWDFAEETSVPFLSRIWIIRDAWTGNGRWMKLQSKDRANCTSNLFSRSKSVRVQIL
jgi:hypothetical protein